MAAFIDKTWNERIVQENQSVQGVFMPLASSSPYGDARTSPRVGLCVAGVLSSGP